MGLVRFEYLVAVRSTGEIARSDDVIGLECVFYFQKHQYQAVECAGGLAVAFREIGQRMIRAMQDRVGVEQHEPCGLLLFFCLTVSFLRHL